MEESIGQQLRRAREARSLTLGEVSRATHMRAHYLQAMESGDFDAIPSLAQARGFLRAYAEFLSLDPAPLLRSLDGNSQIQEASSPAPPASPGPEEKSIPTQEADAIFAEVGRSLRHQRELLGLSLDDVVRHTHLRRHYLMALESGDMQGLPSPVQGRGMLNNYASFLGMDPEPLLLRFADGLQARLAIKKAALSTVEEKTSPAPRRHPALPAPLRRLLTNEYLIGGVVGVFLVGFVMWGAIRIFSMRATEAPSPTAPSIAEILLATPTATITPTPPPQASMQPEAIVLAATTDVPGAETTEQITPPPKGNQAVQVYVTVNQRAWMLITVDGKQEFNGRVIPGSAYSFAGEESVEILTGNGAALQIFFNQQDLGVMGNFGQVVDRVFTQEGIETPTPTITPTSTKTPPLTATPRPTATLRPGTPTVPALP
jgi:cytoskeleton protein RodZ